MKVFFSGFVQKRIKPISSRTVKTRKKQAEKTALEKTANLVLEALVVWCHVTSLLVGRTCDWLTGDDVSGSVLCVILNRQLNSVLTVHKTPLPTTRPGLQDRDWNHSRRKF